MAGDDAYARGPVWLDQDERDLLAGYRTLLPADRSAVRQIVDSMTGLVMPSRQVLGTSVCGGTSERT